MVWHIDLDAFVERAFERPYSSQQGANGDYWGQDTVHFFTVPEESDGDDEAVAKFDAWLQRTDIPEGWEPGARETNREKMIWDREYSPPTQQVLNALLGRGLIEPGKYVVHCWW